MKRRALLTSLVALSLAGGIAACGGGDEGGGNKTNNPPAKAGVNDIGLTPRDQVKDGGQLVWPLSDIPPNFNYLQLDGTLLDNADVINSLLPQVFINDAAGNSIWNKDYLAAEPTLETSPKQKITYKLSDKAKWNDGTPITWADFESQWKANNGKNEAFKISSSNGYADVESVAKGATDKDVVVTYSKNYVDWQTVFVPLYPKSTTTDPAIFNEGWIEKIPGPTAGPFKFSTLDKTAKTVTLARDDAWWGNKAKLDRIVYKAVEDNASADALANGEIDFMEIAANVNLYKRAKEMGDKVALRRAGGPNWRHITINGSKPHIADAKVRQALSMGINRESIGKALLAPLDISPQVLNNRIYMTNHAKYKDNAGEVGKYNLDKAKTLLDEAGWKAEGPVRKKAGAAFTIDFVIPANVAASKSEAELIQAMLKELGVTVNIRAVPVGDLFDKYLTPGDYDMTVFSWIGSPYPVGQSESIYKTPAKDDKGELNIQQNFARVGSSEVDGLLKDATAELNADKSAEAANKVDVALWQLVPNIPMYQRPDLWAVKKDLVNFGAFAYATTIYEDIGYKK